MQRADDVRPFLAAELDLWGIESANGPELVLKYPPFMVVPPPDAPTVHGVSAEIVAVKPPPNEAV